MPTVIKEWVSIIKEEGFRSFIKKKGWTVLAAIVVFYTIRDGILYIIIPYMVYKNFF